MRKTLLILTFAASIFLTLNPVWASWWVHGFTNRCEMGPFATRAAAQAYINENNDTPASDGAPAATAGLAICPGGSDDVASSTSSVPVGTDSATQLGTQLGNMLGDAVINMFRQDEQAAAIRRAQYEEQKRQEAERKRLEAEQRRLKYEADKSEVLSNLRGSAPEAGGGLRDVDTASDNQGLREIHTDTDTAPPVRAEAPKNNPVVPVDNSLQMSNYFFELQTRQVGSDGKALVGGKPVGLPIDTTNMVTASSTDLYQASTEAAPEVDTSAEMLKAGVGEAVNQGYDMAAPAVAESVLSKSFDEAPGVESAYTAAQIMLQIKEGDYTGAGSSSIKFAVGHIPLEGYGIASAQAGGAIVSKTVRADVIGFFQSANGAVGDDASWEHAEQQYNDIFSRLTTAQKTAAADMGQ